MVNDETYHVIELLDAKPSLFDSRQGDDSEATKAIGLITTGEHEKFVRGSEVAHLWSYAMTTCSTRPNRLSLSSRSASVEPAD